MEIIVNGNYKKVSSDAMTYEEIVALAGLPVGPIYTMTFIADVTTGCVEKMGSLYPGESLDLVRGLSFTVTMTGNG